MMLIYDTLSIDNNFTPNFTHKDGSGSYDKS